ncbi:hypothetical protein RINTHH_10420 [Richelia intracellularis HH01]|uniref:Uncharacterized protein n=1 Tax=Richelia intracellularis HH01 TaxID=1165094 RepID=M1WZ26_9NOST|nr:hypothetical protein RINTHH_10420 [Richelia intracellularis HH01]
MIQLLSITYVILMTILSRWVTERDFLDDNMCSRFKVSVSA